ncbi:MAG: flavodoxin family protein [Candidatus Bathyarchaeia archaeon]|jgi:flavodoxin
MNTAIFYMSRTGNTKRFAQAIADQTKAPIHDITITEPSETAKFDLLFFGTPVEGASPTKETTAFIDATPALNGKKAVLFVTYRFFGNKRTMNAMEKKLKQKGCETVLMVSKKGMKPENTSVDFSEALAEIKQVLG